MSGIVARLAKPQMRGHLGKRLRIHLPIAFGLSIFTALGYKYGVMEPRKQAYANFYKNYDALKEFEAMRNAGVFESAKPDSK
ncbi:cytochrome c oxidase subunit 6C-1 [Lethenteron reissneri]|uniref:cytochrome c oxidase subunit 6C-1 n=1 Tax=Lethenteron reissneri TaxID=7753 RepID=UPI002AB65CCB|nr:cytochrome c oxidase subunit 6C-1 [Lethenteron reissneri]